VIKIFLVGFLVTGLQFSDLISQSMCDVTTFSWGKATANEVSVRCSDSTKDYEWSLFVQHHDWELSQKVLGQMTLRVRYETYYELSHSRGTFSDLIDQVREDLVLSDKDMVIVLVDFVRTLPYHLTIGGEQSPETTLARGKGDCSDKSLLLATLFGELGLTTHLVLDTLKEHAFIAFPLKDNGLLAIETTNPSRLIFEERRLEDGQTMIKLEPGQKTLDTQFELLHSVLTWQNEQSTSMGPQYVYGNCEIRQNLKLAASLKNQINSSRDNYNMLLEEYNQLGQSLDSLSKNLNVLIEEYNQRQNSINEWEQSLNEGF
tara:strand:- start:123 stop:1073 length:951 start_codon:yes stop_codon:yes gene_type:complete